MSKELKHNLINQTSNNNQQYKIGDGLNSSVRDSIDVSLIDDPKKTKIIPKDLHQEEEEVEKEYFLNFENEFDNESTIEENLQEIHETDESSIKLSTETPSVIEIENYNEKKESKKDDKLKLEKKFDREKLLNSIQNALKLLEIENDQNKSLNKLLIKHFKETSSILSLSLQGTTHDAIFNEKQKYFQQLQKLDCIFKQKENFINFKNNKIEKIEIEKNQKQKIYNEKQKELNKEFKEISKKIRSDKIVDKKFNEKVKV